MSIRLPVCICPCAFDQLNDFLMSEIGRHLEGFSRLGNYYCQKWSIRSYRSFYNFNDYLCCWYLDLIFLSLTWMGAYLQNHRITDLTRSLKMPYGVLFKSWLANPVLYFQYASLCNESVVSLEGVSRDMDSLELLGPHGWAPYICPVIIYCNLL